MSRAVDASGRRTDPVPDPASTDPVPDPASRSGLVTVGLPAEHGGWSLTMEPAILGLIVAPSGAGTALAAAALLAFVARTPLKVVLVDRWRGRWLARTTLAARVATVELALLVALIVIAIFTAEARFWWPLALAAPLIGLELWYDMRSRGRYLTPELAGAVGIASMAAAIALAGGEARGVAIALWCVMGARAAAALPFVRTQLRRSKQQPPRRWGSDLAQVGAVTVVCLFWLFGDVPVAAVAAIIVLAVFQLIAVRVRPPIVAIIGAQQVVLGLMVVVTTGLGVLAP